MRTEGKKAALDRRRRSGGQGRRRRRRRRRGRRRRRQRRRRRRRTCVFKGDTHDTARRRINGGKERELPGSAVYASPLRSAPDRRPGGDTSQLVSAAVVCCSNPDLTSRAYTTLLGLGLLTFRRSVLARLAVCARTSQLGEALHRSYRASHFTSLRGLLSVIDRSCARARARQPITPRRAEQSAIGNDNASLEELAHDCRPASARGTVVSWQSSFSHGERDVLAILRECRAIAARDRSPREIAARDHHRRSTRTRLLQTYRIVQ